MDDDRIMVLGLDGGSWNVLTPLLEQNKLPTFKKLMMEGVYGRLKSIIPPISVPAWQCYFTGKNPGQLGIYSFLKMDLSSYKFRVATSQDFEGPNIVDILDFRDKTSVVYKLFSTYPAKKINGVMVTDFPSLERGTYPSDIYEDITGKFGEIFHNIAFTTNRVRTYHTVHDETKTDFEVIKWLIKEQDPDFVHMSVPHTDGVQHFFWRDMLDSSSSHHGCIERFWTELDGLLNDLLQFLENREANWRLFIMSDHGFTECQYRFNMANWLVERGYLKLTMRGSLARGLAKFINLDKAYALFERALTFLNERLGVTQAKWGAQHKLSAGISQQVIDFKRSRVIPLEGQLLHVNDRFFGDGEEKERFTEKLIEEISNIVRPDEEQLASQVYRGDGLYNEMAPEVIILSNGVYLYTMPVLSQAWDIPSTGKWTGMHDMDGIFFAYGSEIREGHEIDDPCIVDLMPTILHMYNSSIPEDISGEPLLDIFKEDSLFRQRLPTRRNHREMAKLQSAIKKIDLRTEPERNGMNK